jgi:hypothetical protein
MDLNSTNAVDSAVVPADDIAVRRAELASLLGHLLARWWLEEKQPHLRPPSLEQNSIVRRSDRSMNG